MKVSTFVVAWPYTIVPVTINCGIYIALNILSEIWKANLGSNHFESNNVVEAIMFLA